MESFGNVPTKESTQAILESSKKSLEMYKKRLQEAQDTPVSNLFREGEKANSIKNHQAMIDQVSTDIAKYEADLAQMN